jgi:ketosteroid isomerase-like protein
MSVENTQQTMEAYFQDLVGGGPYKQHFADNVVVALAGTDQGAEGPDDVQAWIDYLHREAFEAHPERKNMFCADGNATVEGDFVGMAATGREVRVPYSVVYDLEGEKIKALRIYMCTEVLVEQLGATASPGLVRRAPSGFAPTEQPQQERRATAWLVHRPHDLFGRRESLVYELKDIRFVVFDLPREQLLPRSIEHLSPVELLADVYAHPGLVHHHLRPSLFGRMPSEDPADSSLLSDLIADL